MQQEIAGTTPLEIHILGVNEAGQESGNPSIVNGRVIPWLQETSDQHVWSDWKVAYRDVVILDVTNTVVGVFNLTTHDLSKSEEYAALKAMLLNAATPED